MSDVNLPIIGYMHSPYQEKFGIPRQPNLVNVESYIEMQSPYNDLSAFEGIEEFSHLWIIWQFHDNKHQQDKKTFRPQVRPPRLGGNKKIGVFATRSMYRPAPIGLSVVQLREVKKVQHAVRVYVTGSDLLDGTPILDIKPYIHYSDAITTAQSGYAHAQPDRKNVVWTVQAQQQKLEKIQLKLVSERIFSELEQVLALDPRPAYQNDPERVYGMAFDQLDVKFRVVDNCIEIQAL